MSRVTPEADAGRCETEENGATAERLQVRIRKAFHPRQDPAFVLDVSFVAMPGITAVFGPSGAGKTTLLNCIAGLQSPGDGRIAIGADVLFDSEEGHSKPPRERRIGYVLQSLALFPHLTAEENIGFGLAGLSVAQRQERIGDALERFRIPHVARRRPAHISGGERQRVALARTLVTEPRALLLDEPLAALDEDTRDHILNDLSAWTQRNPVPVLYVTHLREEAMAIAPECLLMENGKLVKQGTTREVLARRAKRE